MTDKENSTDWIGDVPSFIVEQQLNDEELETADQKLIDTALTVLGLPTDTIEAGIGHWEKKIHDNMWLSIIKGEVNPPHIIEIALFSTESDGRIGSFFSTYALLDLAERTVVDDNGQASPPDKALAMTNGLIRTFLSPTQPEN